MSMLHRSRAFRTCLGGTAANTSTLKPQRCLSAHQSQSYSKKSGKDTQSTSQQASKVSKDLHGQDARLQQDEIIKQRAEEKSPGNNEKKATPKAGVKSASSGSAGK